jgi:hypothetical protein
MLDGIMPSKKTSSGAKSSAKKSSKTTARVKDLSPSKAASAKTKGGYAFKQGFPIKWERGSQ